MAISCSRIVATVTLGGGMLIPSWAFADPSGVMINAETMMLDTRSDALVRDFLFIWWIPLRPFGGSTQRKRCSAGRSSPAGTGKPGHIIQTYRSACWKYLLFFPQTSVFLAAFHTCA